MALIAIIAVVLSMILQQATWLHREGASPFSLTVTPHMAPFAAVGLISWAVWFSRWLMSRWYRPIEPTGYRPTTSVLVPSYREDPQVLARCLETWLENDPDEIIVVPDHEDFEVIAMLANRFGHDKRVRVIPFVHTGKRSAMGVAVRAARSEIVVFSDSDTAWAPDLLDAVLAPFENPSVGGVGTRQNVHERRSSVWRIIADWQVNTRYLDYVPAESLSGGVACLSGRTAAYRRMAVLPNIGDLEREIFMGRQCVAGDDGRLTWLVLKDGWRTVYQSNARAISMFPNTGNAFVKQRIRWSRNSYRCYLTAVFRGWLWRMPLATQVRVLQILLTPLTQTFTLIFIGWAIMHSAWLMTGVGVLWLGVSRMLRSVSHLREYPEDLRYLVQYTAAVIMVALPIKVYAFFTMNRHGWLTRSADSFGGEGQDEASLAPVELGAAA